MAAAASRQLSQESWENWLTDSLAALQIDADVYGPYVTGIFVRPRERLAFAASLLKATECLLALTRRTQASPATSRKPAWCVLFVSKSCSASSCDEYAVTHLRLSAA